jgi:hypothetical protein
MEAPYWCDLHVTCAPKEPDMAATAGNTKRRTKRKTTKRQSNVDTVRKCACGCGKTAVRTFVIGHDAKAKSMLLKVERGEMKAADLPRTLLAPEVRKGDGQIARMLRRLEA